MKKLLVIALFTLYGTAFAANHPAPVPHHSNPAPHVAPAPHVQHSAPQHHENHVAEHHVAERHEGHRVANWHEHHDREEWREHGCCWRREVCRITGFSILYPRICLDLDFVLPTVLWVDGVCGHYEVQEGEVCVKEEWVETVWVPPVFELRVLGGRPPVRVEVSHGCWREVKHPAVFETRIYRIWVAD